jgi:hypothetical protein
LAIKLHCFYPMRSLFLLCFSLIVMTGYAETNDSTRMVQANDSVFIGLCPAKGFKYIQYYRKTRFPPSNATYDKPTGDGFYEFFFTDGDFDVKILPCEYAGKKFRIIGLRTLMDKKTGADRHVMFLDLGPETVAWIELDGAVSEMEIYLE